MNKASLNRSNLLIENFILEASGSADPMKASAARLFATGIVQKCEEWSHDEDSRGTDRADQLGAIVKALGLILSIPFSWGKDGHETNVAEILIEGIAEEINFIAKEKAKWVKQRVKA